MLLDDPTIGLDVEAAQTVRQWVVRLAHDEGKSIVLTTHQLAMAEELSDRVAVIQHGRILTDLPTRELLNRYVEDRFEITVTGAGEDFGAPAGATVTSSNGHTTVQLPTDSQDAPPGALPPPRERSAGPRGQPDPASLEDLFVKLVRGE